MRIGHLLLFNHMLCGANYVWTRYRKKKFSFLQFLSLVTILLADILLVSSALAVRNEKKRHDREKKRQEYLRL